MGSSGFPGSRSIWERTELICVKVEDVKFGDDGLVPVIVQDADSGAVLSLFYCNREAFLKMLEEGYVWRFSRKLGRIIKKGEASGNCQKVVSMSKDCDSDALLVAARPEGPACHTGSYSCFSGKTPILWELVDVISGRKSSPKEGSYVSGMVADRQKVAAKLREELGELLEAEKDAEVVWEAADLLFFMLVYLENRNIKFSQVLQELKRRRKD
ncbi:TPA: phosphoribosyl-ATP diphosphatase [Candidatus Micrarchaeota archaeon]|nr:phosphoribosyl-ATP diphosphatase [Candidatus Micrarchaeota archaeon]